MIHTFTPPVPPTALDRPLPFPLGLVQIEHAVFESDGGFSADDRDYFTDLMASYAMDLHDTALAEGRTSFTDMVTAVLPRLGPYASGFDLAVLCGAVPDAQPGFPLGHLSDAVPEAGLGFAVFDQGVIAPFTALRLVAAAARTTGCRRALVLVTDQSRLLHTRPVPDWLRPEQDSVVVLALDEVPGADAISTPRSSTARPQDVATLLEQQQRLLSSLPATTVVGQGLARCLSAPLPTVDTVVAEPGLPCTGLWSALAGKLGEWRERGRDVLLADYDETQQRLSTCTMRVRPASESAGRPA
ncbi:hypothetical protein [Streptomyces europaeiscabiei]|uniref:hypothetical protein n=1 Tax=Streptomyces europaeiscabiei TaxID=146819 RepID=UPI0029A70968|nr:hypothetical protein [Streptomyces europaeiscabiei]MDX2525286.1 hypothetical protein [Streptomyces europaeiscabiei]